MAGYEFEDDKGNRYRITKGAGPGYIHPENIGAGSTIVASDIFCNVPYLSIAGAGNHFWFDVLSKIPDLPLPPRDALSTAVAESYLTVEKLDTALAIDNEVIDNSAYLRIDIQNAMARIIAEEKREAAMYQRQMDKESLGNKALIYLGGFAYGVYRSGKDLALWLKEVSDLVNPVVRMQHHFRALQAAWVSDTPLQTYSETYLEGEWRELVEVLGFDPSLVIVDTQIAAPMTGVKSVSATFKNVGEFANTELPDKFPKEFTDKAMTPEFQAEYSKHYKDAEASGGGKKKWSSKNSENYLNTTDMSPADKKLMKQRFEMHGTIGNNDDYLGNGLTKNNNPEVDQQYGAVETLNFERNKVNLSQLKEQNAIAVMPELSRI